jgi:AmmeMemoRadiSam system protein B
MFRKAAVKGHFYPDSREEVEAFISANAVKNTKKIEALCIVLPHAGWIYSGATAVKTASAVKIPDKIILLGPNHTGLGARISVYPSGSWETPLGDVPVDEETAAKLTASPICKADTLAHLNEHSLEVLVPILKYFNPNIKITPVTVSVLGEETCAEFARLLFETADDNTLIVVSSDMNHFENSEITDKKDGAALEALLELDASKLRRTVHSMNISMCGAVPAGVAISYSKMKNSSGAELVEHTHSGYVSGDHSRVVGYAGVHILK